jgi:hypothetical protein
MADPEIPDTIPVFKTGKLIKSFAEARATDTNHIPMAARADADGHKRLSEDTAKPARNGLAVLVLPLRPGSHSPSECL